MLVVSVAGLKDSGKTTCIEALVRELKTRGLKVGTVKSMMHSRMTLDTEGKDTWRHSQAGADFVIALSRGEMAYVERRECSGALSDMARLIPEDTDILLCEGLPEPGPGAMCLVAASDHDSIDETLRVRGLEPERVTAYVGLGATAGGEHGGKRVFDCTSADDMRDLADMLLDPEARVGL